MPKLGSAQLKMIEDGLLASPRTPAKSECDRLLKAHGYLKALDLKDPIEKVAMQIADGLSTEAGGDERKACDDLLRRYGYEKVGPANAPFSSRNKPGPKPRASQNSSREAMQQCIRATRLHLLLDTSYTEHRVIALLAEIHVQFALKRDAGVFFTRGDCEQIIQCVPLLPERRATRRRFTYQASLRTQNNISATPQSECEYLKFLSSLPILKKPKITDPIKICADENSLIECFKAAQDFDIESSVNAFSSLWDEAKWQQMQSDCYCSLGNALGLSTKSRPKIIEAAHRELVRMSEQYSGARYISKGWAWSIDWVFQSMDAEMMLHDHPAVAASDYGRILKTAVCRQYHKSFDDPLVTKWFEM